MKKNPLVSIIIITYNSAKYVIDTLESAKNQTYQNIELIITDDASQDNTISICRDWLEENKVRFVKTELIVSNVNTGIPANCNRGVNACNGSWIKLIAGDDKLFTNCISENIQFVLNNLQISFLFSRFNLIDEEGNEIINHIRIKRYSYLNSEIYFNLNPKKQFLKLVSNNFVCAPTSFINRSALINLGLFDEEYKLCEDFPLWLKSTFNGYQLYFMPVITVAYRVSKNSLTDSYDLKFYFIYFKIISSYFSLKFIIQNPLKYLFFRIKYFNIFRIIQGKKYN